MRPIVLRTSAAPVYRFLSLITAQGSQDGTMPRGKILECGAGGALPPLTLFAQHGFEGWGIDTSQQQLDKARVFCRGEGIGLHLSRGDMRQIPFATETFDYVYEHYAMCHLSKRDTGVAVREMYRVLKRGGLCFLGVISTDTWPKALFGEERARGEYWGEEDGQLASHSMFPDEEAEELVSAWDVVSKEKHITYLQEAAEALSLDAWMELREEVGPERYARADWRARYESRMDTFCYAHLYYFLRKP